MRLDRVELAGNKGPKILALQKTKKNSTEVNPPWRVKGDNVEE